MRQFILIILLSAGLSVGAAYSLGLLDDFFVTPLPPPIHVKTPTRPLVDLGEDLYKADTFPEIPKAQHRDPIVLLGVMNAMEQEEVASRVNGQLIFIGEQVDDRAALAAGSAAFLSEPYYFTRIEAGKQKFVKFYRRIYDGETVRQGQMLGLVEPGEPLQGVLKEIARIAGAEADLNAAIAAENEGYKRERRANILRNNRTISEEDYGAALLTYLKLHNERLSKFQAVRLAEIDKDLADVKLSTFEIRPTLQYDNLIVKSILKQRGAVVKAGDPVMLVQNLSRLQAEALIEEQYFSRLKERIDKQARAKDNRPITATIEPTIVESPRELPGHSLDVTCVAVSKDMKIVSGSEDKSVLVWTADGFAPLREFKHDDSVRVVACTPPAAARNLCLVGSASGSVYLWDLDKNDAAPLKLVEKAHGNDTAITAVAFSPKGEWFATGGSDGSIRLWDTTTTIDGVDDYAKERYAFTPENGAAERHEDAVTSLSFTPQCRLVSASRDKSLRVWLLKDKGAALDRQPLLNRGPDNVPQLGVSQDGRWMLFDQGHTLKMISIESQALTHTLSVPANATPFDTLAIFSPDSSLILTAGAPEGRLQLWRTPDAKTRGFEVRQFATKVNRPVTCAAFSPDAGKGGVNSFAVSAASRNLYVWSIPTPAEVNEHRIERVPMTLINQSLDPNTRVSRIGFEVANPVSERYPTGRFEAGRPVTIVID
jgi:WD40 repeat protein